MLNMLRTEIGTAPSVLFSQIAVVKNVILSNLMGMCHEDGDKN